MKAPPTRKSVHACETFFAFSTKPVLGENPGVLLLRNHLSSLFIVPTDEGDISFPDLQCASEIFVFVSWQLIGGSGAL
jgi:hypothetical protein